MDLRRVPKIELHLHLDCSLSYEAVRRLRPGVTQEEYAQEYVAPAKCTNLADFLSRAPKGFLLMQSAEALELVVADLFEQLRADGVVYAEIRFAPLLHLEGGLSAQEVVRVIEGATRKGIAATGVEARLILCTLRHFTAEQSMTTAQLAAEFRGSLVTAIDLAADEAGFPLDAHAAAFEFALREGICRTAHAGEACGPASVWETLERLKPTRIGHGTRSYEDAALVEHLKREGIHLELCPSANVQIIPSIDSWLEHPIDRLYRAGVRLNANTDSRMLTPTTLTAEYEGLHKYFGWGMSEFLRTNLIAIDAAFCDEGTKAELRRKLEIGFGGSLKTK
jgi:adenosine deaminase